MLECGIIGFLIDWYWLDFINYKLVVRIDIDFKLLCLGKIN